MNVNTHNNDRASLNSDKSGKHVMVLLQHYHTNNDINLKKKDYYGICIY